MNIYKYEKFSFFGCGLHQKDDLQNFFPPPSLFFVRNTFFVHRKRGEKKVSALSFVYFNSWPVILTALPAVMVASRRCETRS